VLLASAILARIAGRAGAVFAPAENKEADGDAERVTTPPMRITVRIVAL